MPWMPRALLAVVAALWLGACRTAPPETSPEAPRPVTNLDSRDVYADGRLIGRLHHLAIEDPRERIVFWRAETPDRQYLGFADTQGRFFQRVPFADSERFLGIYPMERGLQLLYETDAKIRIGPAEADLRKDSR